MFPSHICQIHHPRTGVKDGQSNIFYACCTLGMFSVMSQVNSHILKGILSNFVLYHSLRFEQSTTNPIYCNKGHASCRLQMHETHWVCIYMCGILWPSLIIIRAWKDVLLDCLRYIFFLPSVVAFWWLSKKSQEEVKLLITSSFSSSAELRRPNVGRAVIVFPPVQLLLFLLQHILRDTRY